MLRHFSLVVLLAGLGVFGSSRPALACSCMPAGPACQAFWKTDAVFDATVLSITPLKRTESIGGREPSFADKLVKLDVHRSWKGAQPGPLEVTTSGTGASCGYDFEEGQRYLIFARHGGDGLLAVSLCSATQKYDGAGPAAEFLASFGGPESGGRVFGTVRTGVRNFEGGSYSESATATPVKLSGGGQEWRVMSSGGRYEFTGLEAGSYRVEVQVPEGYSTYSVSREVQIANRRACAEEDYRLSPAGRISGRLVGPDGRALPSVRVELTSPEARPKPDYGLSTALELTDKDGFFEFRGLPPGRYIAGVNLRDLPNQHNPYARTVYPGTPSDPHVIALSLGQAIDLGTWHMPPPLAVVRVAGIVTGGGTPVAGVYVSAWDITGDPGERSRGAGGTTSGEDGRFALELRRGRVYTFIARDRQSKQLRISAPRIDTGTNLPELIRIVILDDRPE
ncbi:MAG TPA: hypothetical protein VJ813_01575 [Vicinamibacterales bacterium]|nr:hypothetical protein [Vicinamibacterales bacterium]